MKWLACAILAGSLATMLYVRLRLLDYPLERDEGEYAYAGQLLLEGIPPYKLAYNMKLPGTYMAYAGIMAVFGQTPAGIHLGLLTIHLATLIILFALTKRLFGFSGAAVATSAYALMAMSPVYYGLSAHATHFVVLPALAGTWLLARFDRSSPSLTVCFSAGLLFGIAFLMKQPGMFFGLFAGSYLMWMFARNYLQGRASGAARSLYEFALKTGVFALACVLPFLGVCLWLKMAGVFPQFWFWTFSYARQYAAIFTLKEGLPYLGQGLLRMFGASPIFCAAGLVGLVLLGTTGQDIDKRFFLSSFLVFSFLAVCPGYYFRPHYFVLLLPAVALLIGLATQWGEDWFQPTPQLQVLPLAIALLGCVVTLLTYREVFFKFSPVEVCKSTYPFYSKVPFTEASAIARYLEQHTQQADRIAVIGSEPEIYFYSHRLSSTGYIYTYALTEPQPFAAHMQAEMIREIEENPPSYLILVSVRNSLASHIYWDTEPTRKLLGWVEKYTAAKMQPVGLIEMHGLDVIQRVWGPKAAVAPTQDESYIQIFESKNRSQGDLPSITKPE